MKAIQITNADLEQLTFAIKNVQPDKYFDFKRSIKEPFNNNKKLLANFFADYFLMVLREKGFEELNNTFYKFQQIYSKATVSEANFLLKMISHLFINLPVFISTAPAEILMRRFEGLIFGNIAKSHESIRWYRQIMKIFSENMKMLAQKGPFIKISESSKTVPKINSDGNEIVFYVCSGAYLAHVTNIVTYLRPLLKKNTGFKFTLMFIGIQDSQVDNVLKNDLKQYGINYVCIKATISLIDEIHKYLDLNKSLAVIAVSVPMYIESLNSKYPVRTYKIGLFSMKYHYNYCNGLDLRFASGSICTKTEVYDNLSWPIIRSHIPNFYLHRPKVEKITIRNKLLNHLNDANNIKNYIFIGCIGRIEKIESKTYLKSLSIILKNNPRAIFVYTGRDNNYFIQLCHDFDIKIERCIFLGWLPPAHVQDYVSALDIYIDSFPFGSGHTAFQAIQSKIPIVSMLTDESRESSFLKALLIDKNYLDDLKLNDDIIDTHEFLQETVCSSHDEYIQVVEKLMCSAEYRDKVAEAWFKLFDHFNPSEQEAADDLICLLLRLIKVSNTYLADNNSEI